MLVKIGFLTFVLSAILCFLIIIFSTKNKKFLDNHNGIQNIHRTAVPRIGGIAILISLSVGLITFYIKFKDINYIYLIICMMITGLIGFYEDVEHKLSARFRLLLCLCSAIIAILLLDAYIVRTGLFFLDYLVKYKIISLLFSAVAIAGITNAINIIDGLNGLSSGTAMILFMALGYVAFKFQDFFIISIIVIMEAAILGFFMWNYPYGRIFLGDGGAYIIGFSLGVISIFQVKRNIEISPWFPILVLLYPVFETLFSIYRRSLKKNKSAVEADNLHLHSLFYRRVIPYFVIGNLNQSSINSATSPFLWMLCSFSIVPSIIFQNNTLILFFATVLFICFYIWLYKSLVNFKIKCILRFFNIKSPDKI